MLLWPLPSFATVSGRRNDVAFRFTTLTVEKLVGRIPPLPPLVNNTNPETKTEFVLFFSNEYFGIKVDLDGKKKNQPGV